MHYYKHHIGDYIKDTAHLSLLEHGVYMRLLHVYYIHESPLPEASAGRMIGARSQEEKEAVQVILLEFFQLADGAWHHNRCDEEIAEYKAMEGRNKENGKLGGRPRKNPGKTQSVISGNPLGTHSEPTGNPDVTQTEPTQNPNHKPLTINQEPIKAIGENQPITPKQKRQSQMPEGFLPNKTHTLFAEENRLNLQDEFLRFSDHHAAKGSKFADWDAALRTWLRNAVKYHSESPSLARKIPKINQLPTDYGQGGKL